jgi:hypothetical protein
MEHKLEKNDTFGIYREMADSPDELVILGNLEKGKDFVSSNKDEKDKFFTLPRVERVTPVTPVEPVEKVTPVTPVGSDENYEGYHTVLSFQKDIKTGKKVFVKTSRAGNNERERLMVQEDGFFQHGSMEIDENEAQQEQLPPHHPYKKE